MQVGDIVKPTGPTNVRRSPNWNSKIMMVVDTKQVGKVIGKSMFSRWVRVRWDDYREGWSLKILMVQTNTPAQTNESEVLGVLQGLAYPFLCLFYGLPVVGHYREAKQRAEAWQEVTESPAEKAKRIVDMTRPEPKWRVGDRYYANKDVAIYQAMQYGGTVEYYDGNDELVVTKMNHAVQTGWGKGHGQKISEAYEWQAVCVTCGKPGMHTHDYSDDYTLDAISNYMLDLKIHKYMVDANKKELDRMKKSLREIEEWE